jgi:transcription antitermination factor NusG
MAYWCAARLQPNREALALHCLGLAGYETYFPRLRDRRTRHGRKIELRPALFPGYAFVLIELQWHAARWTPGTLGLIMNGVGPAHVHDNVIAEIRRREVDGFVELPKPNGLRRGDRVRVTHGLLAGQLGIYAGMKPRQRVEVLLQLLGSMQRVILPRGAIELTR